MSTWLEDPGPSVSRPHGAITTNKALHLAPVMAAVRHITDYVSTLPVDAYRKDSEIVRTPVALPRFLASLDAPGGRGVVSWLSQYGHSIATCGNAVAWVAEFDSYGYPTSLPWIGSDDWSFDEQAKQWYVFGEPVPAARIFHVPWIVPAGRTLGLSPIEHFASTVSAGLSAQEYADVKRAGGMPPLTMKNTRLELDAKVSSSIKQRLVASLAKGEPMVMGADWEMSAFTMPANQQQFIETLKLSANQVAAAYGIDPTEIGGSAANSLTYSTEELRQINRAANMRPYIVRIERAMTRAMPTKQYVQMNIDATIRVDLKTRTEVTGAKLLDGRMNVNEARAQEDQGPIPGGDRYNVPTPAQAPAIRTEETP